MSYIMNDEILKVGNELRITIFTFTQHITSPATQPVHSNFLLHSLVGHSHRSAVAYTLLYTCQNSLIFFLQENKQ